MDIEKLELSEANNRPKTMEIRILSGLLNQSFIATLSRTFGRYPGNDNVELLVEETSGRTMRAEIPLHVDTRNVALRAEGGGRPARPGHRRRGIRRRAEGRRGAAGASDCSEYARLRRGCQPAAGTPSCGRYAKLQRGQLSGRFFGLWRRILSG